MFDRLRNPSLADWASRARAWLAERARLREDSEAVARMDARELRDLGLSHVAAARGEVMRQPLAASGEPSWIHAQPRFLPRATARSRARFGHGHAL